MVSRDEDFNIANFSKIFNFAFVLKFFEVLFF